jgi:hypothetical protein
LKRYFLFFIFALYHSFALANNCSIPYAKRGENQLFDHKNERIKFSNFWDQDFKASKFIKKNPQIKDYNLFLSKLIKLEERGTQFWKNYKDLIEELYTSGKLSKESFVKFESRFKNHIDRTKPINELVKVLNQKNLTTHKLKESLIASKLNQDHFMQLNSALKGKELSQSQIDELDKFIRYLQVESEETIRLALTQLDDLYSLNLENKIIKRYQKHLEKVASYENKMQARLSEQYKKMNKGELSEQLENRAKAEARAKAKSYDDLLRSCKNRDDVEPHAAEAEKKFTKFILTFSTISTIGGFAVTHTDEENMTTWSKKLAYELGISVTFSWLQAKVAVRPEYSFMKKAGINFGASTGLDVIDSSIYDYLFSNEEEKEEVKKYAQTEEGKKYISELTNYLETKQVDTAFANRFEEFYDLREGAGPSDKINLKDLESQEQRDDILKYVNGKMHQEGMSQWIDTGSAGIDRFIFHRGWDLISIPKSIVVSMAMYRLFCMAPINPQKAKLLAASIMIADELYESFVFYYTRKGAINQ